MDEPERFTFFGDAQASCACAAQPVALEGCRYVGASISRGASGCRYPYGGPTAPSHVLADDARNVGI